MIWFTSDTHFGHNKVIEFCKRPFASVEEMDAEIIKRWNYMVGHGDTVYHLGDFAFAGAQEKSNENLAIINKYQNALKGLAMGTCEKKGCSVVAKEVLDSVNAKEKKKT